MALQLAGSGKVVIVTDGRMSSGGRQQGPDQPWQRLAFSELWELIFKKGEGRGQLQSSVLSAHWEGDCPDAEKVEAPKRLKPSIQLVANPNGQGVRRYWKVGQLLAPAVALCCLGAGAGPEAWQLRGRLLEVHLAILLGLRRPPGTHGGAAAGGDDAGVGGLAGFAGVRQADSRVRQRPPAGDLAPAARDDVHVLPLRRGLVGRR
ncbi:unnamed protein product, partial [Prorocentrum cordatum]